MMARFDKAALLAAPTIEERIALGRQQNSTANGAIIPFPSSWEAEMLDVTFRPGGGHLRSKLLNDGYAETSLFYYHSAEGQVVSAIARLDSRNNKQTLPIRAARVVGCNPNLEIKALDPFRPLYNLNGLAAEPEKRVIITEGEKAAEGARSRLLDLVATTWPGGCKAVHFADWRPLIGRQVLIWPDHDKPGWEAAKTLGEILHNLGVADVRVVNTPDTYPEGWDVADPLPEIEHV
jgi:hypothetical protein